MKDRIKNIIAKTLKLPIDQITEESEMDNTEGWDSINSMMMIVALEREFSITIPDEIVGNLVSFKLIHEAILKLDGKSA